MGSDYILQVVLDEVDGAMGACADGSKEMGRGRTDE